MSKPKTIFLDWYKTLSNSLFWQQLKEPGHRLNKKLVDIESVLLNKDFDLINNWMLGKLSSEDACDFISSRTGVDSKLLHDELVISCKQMTFIDEKIGVLLKKIKEKKIKLVIATDNMDTFSKYTYPEINKDNLFDGFINSYEVGCFKYDYKKGKLAFFDSYLREHQLDYDEVVLMDDHVDKEGNFQRLGFEIVNINENRQLAEVLESY